MLNEFRTALYPLELHCSEILLVSVTKFCKQEGQLRLKTIAILMVEGEERSPPSPLNRRIHLRMGRLNKDCLFQDLG